MNKTVKTARKEVFARIAKGSDCPCCDQYVKLYRRNLNSSMARGLIAIYRYFKTGEQIGFPKPKRSRKRPPAAVYPKPGTEWLHIPSFFTGQKICSSNDGALLRHWGLITQLRKDRKDGSWRNGYYQITPLGRAFVESRIKVPTYAYLYNRTLFGLSDGSSNPRRETTIVSALGKRFNYRKLMAT